jgi:hypothetical protein
MQKKETRFKINFKKKLDKIPDIYAVKIQQVSIRGTPDFLLCVRGRFIAIELKAEETGEPDALQRFNLNKITRAGGIGIVANPKNQDKVLELINTISRGGDYDRIKLGYN